MTTGRINQVAFLAIARRPRSPPPPCKKGGGGQGTPQIVRAGIEISGKQKQRKGRVYRSGLARRIRPTIPRPRILERGVGRKPIPDEGNGTGIIEPPPSAPDGRRGRIGGHRGMGRGSFRRGIPGVRVKSSGTGSGRQRAESRALVPGTLSTPVVTGVGHTGVARAFRHILAEHNSRANTGVIPKPRPADRAPLALERGRGRWERGRENPLCTRDSTDATTGDRAHTGEPLPGGQAQNRGQAATREDRLDPRAKVITQGRTGGLGTFSRDGSGGASGQRDRLGGRRGGGRHNAGQPKPTSPLQESCLPIIPGHPNCFESATPEAFPRTHPPCVRRLQYPAQTRAGEGGLADPTGTDARMNESCTRKREGRRPRRELATRGWRLAHRPPRANKGVIPELMPGDRAPHVDERGERNDEPAWHEGLRRDATTGDREPEGESLPGGEAQKRGHAAKRLNPRAKLMSQSRTGDLGTFSRDGSGGICGQQHRTHSSAEGREAQRPATEKPT